MREQGKLNAGNNMRRFRGQYLHYAAYGFLLLFLYLLQMTPNLMPQIGGGRPLLLLLAAVCIGMFNDPVVGGVFGAVAGFAWDMFSDRLTGLGGLYLLAVGCACGLLVQLLMRNNAISALVLCGSATALYLLLEWLITCVLWRLEGSVAVLLYQVIPNFIYTLVLALPVYYLTLAIAKRLKARE